MNDHDERQFSLMHRQIEDYEAGYLALSGLIGDLEFLHAALEQEDAKWDRRYLDQVGTLEECYAVMLYENRVTLNDLETKLVAKAIEDLKISLSEKFRS